MSVTNNYSIDARPPAKDHNDDPSSSETETDSEISIKSELETPSGEEVYQHPSSDSESEHSFNN